MHLDVNKEQLIDLEIEQDARTNKVIGTYTVLGHLPHLPSKNKVYVFQCSICANDPYLFGSGLFATYYNNIRTGLPCGCGNFVYPEKLQYKRIKRIVEAEGDFSFIGFEGKYEGIETKCIVSCVRHGVNSKTTVTNVVRRNKAGCNGCYLENARIKSTPTEQETILKFFSSGGFHKDTKFYKTERLSKCGKRTYWRMICGECGGFGESIARSFIKGFRSCDCARDRQRQAYINLIYDASETPIALKFGVSNLAVNRLTHQNSMNALISRQYELYEFETKIACLSAERAVKSSVKTSLLSKEVFPDGYTETTSIKYLIEIQKIYKKYGGVSIMNVLNETLADGYVAFVEAAIFGIDHGETSSPYFRTKNDVRD